VNFWRCVLVLGSRIERFVSDRVSRVERGIFYVIQDEARRLEKLGNEMTYLHLGNPKYSLPEHLLNAGKDAMREGYIRYTGDKGLTALSISRRTGNSNFS